MMSRIERVTVYREGARVERSLAIESAASEARFTDLPLSLDDGSVRARVEGDDGALAVDVRVGLDAPSEEDPALAPAEDEALRAARDRVEKCRGDIARLQAAVARLESLKVGPRPLPRENEPPLPIPLESRQRLLALRTSEEQRLGSALAAAHAAQREADAKLVEEQARAKRATTARNAKRHELRKVITVSLAAAKAGAKVLVEYAVPGARWSPAYVVTLSEKKAKLGMRAQVAQRTGEDWTGVRLCLSTASADAWFDLPELAKARIGRAQPHHPKRGYRAPPEGARGLYADYDRVAGAPLAAAIAAEEPEEETTPTATLGFGAPPQGGVAGFDAAPPMRLGAPPSPMQFQNAPVPRAAPMPAMPMAMPTSQSRAKGGSSMLLGAAAVGAAVVAAPIVALSRAVAPKKRQAVEKSESFDLLEEDGETQTRLPEEHALDWELAGESLAYARLRMRGPSDEARGELVAIAAASVYVEALGVRVRVDVGAAVRAAFTRAVIDESALPPGHELAHTNDAYDYLYAADLPCDVASDGAFHAVPVADWDATTVLRHVCVPREAQQVFRLLEIESPIDAALLSGPLDVYEGVGDDARYRTTTRMPDTPPRGRVEIGLGVEPAIKVARTTTFQEETAGLLGGSLALGHHISVELRNLLPRAVTVEVRERVPVVRKDDAEVKLEVGAVEPAWEKWDQEQSLRGGYMWKVPLDGGATRTVSARYTIKISSKLEIIGGNRRES